MGQFSNALCGALAPAASVPDTPRRRQQALRQAQELEKSWLMGRQLLLLVHILQQDNLAVDTYMVLEGEVRIAWVCDKLEIEIPIHWSDSE